jgi:hypothetical protein
MLGNGMVRRLLGKAWNVAAAENNGRERKQ